jgi:hypothetical protein
MTRGRCSGDGVVIPHISCVGMATSCIGLTGDDALGPCEVPLPVKNSSDQKGLRFFFFVWDDWLTRLTAVVMALISHAFMLDGDYLHCSHRQ